jgi:hypothetical protein
MEKAKEVVGTIDRVDELSLHVPGVGANLQIATVVALRELLFVANLNEVVHFSVVCACIYKIRANKFCLPTISTGGIQILNLQFRVSILSNSANFTRMGRWAIKEC